MNALTNPLTPLATAFALAIPMIAASVLAPPAAAQDRGLVLDARERVAVASAPFRIDPASQDLRQFLPQGALANAGADSAEVVLWIEVPDRRRGYASLSSKQGVRRPQGAIPLAVGQIPSGDRVAYGLLTPSKRFDLARLRTAGEARLILAARSEAPLRVRGEAAPPDAAVSFPGDMFFPGGSFFPSDTFFPGDMF